MYEAWTNFAPLNTEVNANIVQVFLEMLHFDTRSSTNTLECTFFDAFFVWQEIVPKLNRSISVSRMSVDPVQIFAYAVNEMLLRDLVTWDFRVTLNTIKRSDSCCPVNFSIKSQFSINHLRLEDPVTLTMWIVVPQGSDKLYCLSKL